MIKQAAPVIELRDVEKRFSKRVVLQDVNLTVAAPSVIGLIGDNGAGKTTLLRLIAGILQPNRGSVRVLGNDPRDGGVEFHRQLGGLIERPGHYDELTVVENLRYFYSFYSANADEVNGAIDEALRRFGLAQRKHDKAGQLSSGYRQRLAIARGAHPWARLLLLDEPFDGLDPRARSEVKSELAGLQDGSRVILFSSHNLVDIDQISDSIVLVSGGGVKRFQSFSEIRRMLGGIASEDLDAVYARLTTEVEAQCA